MKQNNSIQCRHWYRKSVTILHDNWDHQHWINNGFNGHVVFCVRNCYRYRDYKTDWERKERTVIQNWSVIPPALSRLVSRRILTPMVLGLWSEIDLKTQPTMSIKSVINSIQTNHKCLQFWRRLHVKVRK
jgi:hypothetical protein